MITLCCVSNNNYARLMLLGSLFDPTERNRAIAVSVRNFRVAGIRGLLNSDEVLSIRTAVQVAMEYQTRGLEAQAEQIYRSILSESPQHADALHLLGVIFYQKGDASSAVPYIERALQSNKTFEGFHNSLGELRCLYCCCRGGIQSPIQATKSCIFAF